MTQKLFRKALKQYQILLQSSLMDALVIRGEQTNPYLRQLSHARLSNIRMWTFVTLSSSIMVAIFGVTISGSLKTVLRPHFNVLNKLFVGRHRKRIDLRSII